MPKVLCECGCGLNVSVQTARRHLDGKARPHVKASTGHWDTVSVIHPRHSQKIVLQTRIAAVPKPMLVPQEACDISEPMDWSLADSPVRPMSCEPISPTEATSCSSKPFSHLAKSLRAPLVESDDEDNLRRSPSPTLELDSNGPLSSSEDEGKDMPQDRLSAWHTLGEHFEQDLTDIGASKTFSIIQAFDLHFHPQLQRLVTKTFLLSMPLRSRSSHVCQLERTPCLPMPSPRNHLLVLRMPMHVSRLYLV